MAEFSAHMTPRFAFGSPGCGEFVAPNIEAQPVHRLVTA
jgi:hypothetical protein